MDHTLPGTPIDKMIHEIKLIDIETGEVFDNSLTYIFIEAPKFPQQEADLKTPLDRWMYALTNLTQFQEIPLTLKDDPIFKDFFMVAELLQMTHEEREAYLVSLKEKWDEYSLKETAMIMGKEEGRAAGKAEGLIAGSFETKLNIATLMKANDEPIQKIVLYTGLTPKQINSL